MQILTITVNQLPNITGVAEFLTCGIMEQLTIKVSAPSIPVRNNTTSGVIAFIH